jgi:hypothetical protein
VDIKRSLLVIADIGGYTRYMLATRMALAHGQVSISQLIEAVLDGATHLEMAKLEGDAVFFHAPEGATDPLGEAASMTAHFRQKKRELIEGNMCSCNACTHLEDLTLKFVVHTGEVAYHKVRQHVELAGVDVILVHRMLKNDVPIKEYVLMTEAVLAGQGSTQVRERVCPLTHDFEGIGPTSTHYLELAALPDPPPAEGPKPPSPCKLRSIWKTFGLTARALPYLLGKKKPLEAALDRAADPEPKP